jgi:two-component system, NarL family, response regulator
VIAQAENGEQAIALFEQHQPNITLMDLRMPEVEKVDAIRVICAIAINLMSIGF